MKRTATVLLLLSFAFAPSLIANAAPKPHEDVEARITELHAKLKINDSQEDMWKAVSQEMRDRSQAMHDLAETRLQHAKTMTALDDLKSYAEITEAHAEGMRKFLDVFSPLYNSMSDDQKKNADEIFRGHKDAKKKAHM